MRPGILSSIATALLFLSINQISYAQCPGEVFEDGDCLFLSYFTGDVPSTDPPVIEGFDYVSGSGGGTYQFVTTGIDPNTCSGGLSKSTRSLIINGDECVYESSVLPVKLSSFDLKKVEDNSVALNWTTSVEINNDYFEIFKSNDGRNFDLLQSVKGNGTSNERVNYTFIDEQPFSGLNYYYISQIDFDGNVTDFDMKRVDVSTNSSLNATLRNNQLSVQNINSQAEIHVVSIDGRLMINTQLNSNDILDLSDLIQGFYIISISEGSSSESMKIFVK